MERLNDDRAARSPLGLGGRELPGVDAAIAADLLARRASRLLAPAALALIAILARAAAYAHPALNPPLNPSKETVP